VKPNSKVNLWLQTKIGTTQVISNLILTTICAIVATFSLPTYAASGGVVLDSTTNTGVITSGASPSTSSPGTTITPLTTGISSSSNSFNQFGNSYSSYSGNSGSCGLQLYANGGASGANNPYAITNTSPGGSTNSSLGSAPNSTYQLQAGIVWNEQKCIDQKEILQLQTKTQETQIKIQTQTTQNTTCIQQRGEITKTALSNKLPMPTKIQLDEVCRIIE
jgi:hypothetical protein